MSQSKDVYRLAVDIGGTFTDVVLERGAQRWTTKVLTTHEAPENGVLSGIQAMLAEAGAEAGEISILIHGTTLATNALIERRGARTALLTTAGFADCLEMGYEKRFAQYDIRAKRPEPLIPADLRFEVPERVTASGRVDTPLDPVALAEAAQALAEAQVEAVAIGFLHAYAHPAHEEAAQAALAQALPGATICLSSAVCPEMREYERFSTTAANAYVRPLMAGYLGRLRDRLAAMGLRAPVYLMTSGGGLTTLETARRFPIRLVESGPAGGAILCAELAQAHGLASVMGFDMGGTTAKICLIEDGRPDRRRNFEIARAYQNMKGSGLPVRIPVIEMVEIGAGGGSIARVDSLGNITVGPDSAGSDPGPTAYGRGGSQATVTDANLCLGRIDPDRFAGGRIPLDRPGAEAALARDIGTPLGLADHWPAAGVAEMVEENMANAGRVHAVERGRETQEYTMIAFGGGAPLHAAALATKLGIRRVLVPKGAGVGSAIGFLRAPVTYEIARSFRTPLTDDHLPEINTRLAEMVKAATEIVRPGAGESTLETRAQVDLRYKGQGHDLTLPLAEPALTSESLAELRTAFEELYARIYGLTLEDVPIEAVAWSVTAGTPPPPRHALPDTPPPVEADHIGTRDTYDSQAGAPIPHGVYLRPALAPGARIDGPALVTEDETSTHIPSGWSVTVTSDQSLLLERREAP